MDIHTTIHISDYNKLKLERLAVLLNMNVNHITCLLITYYIQKNSKAIKMFSRIRYQKRKNNEKWLRLHVTFSPGFYEKCQDLRKFHKLSISSILSKAIELYSQEIIKNKYDNYFHNYIIFMKIVDDSPQFLILWNYQEEKKMRKLYEMYENS